jgi:hypothetical protein
MQRSVLRISVSRIFSVSSVADKLVAGPANSICEDVAESSLRFLIQTKSGEKFSPLMVCVLPLPVYSATSITVLPSAIVGSGRLVVQSALKPLGAV